MEGSVGPRVIDISASTVKPACSPMIRVHLHSLLRSGDHLYRRRRRALDAPRIPHRGSGRHRTSWKSATCCCTESCQTRRRKSSSRTASPTTRWCMSRCTTSSAASAGIAIPWQSWSGLWRTFRFLSRQHGYHGSAPAPDRISPADRQDADDSSDGLQVLIGQPFVYPRNDLDYAANSLHDLFGAGRGQVNRSCARHGPHLHSPRRP